LALRQAYNTSQGIANGKLARNNNAQGTQEGGARLTSASVSAWVKAIGFDPKKGTKTTELKSWEVDGDGVKWALTLNKERFDTFKSGSQGGITSDGGEDDTFAADAPLADAAFGK
jgi:hypothetical protein